MADTDLELGRIIEAISKTQSCDRTATFGGKATR